MCIRDRNHSEWEAFSALNRNVEYLSPERQLSLGFRMVQFVPWNHFGRKSVGYLYAIKQGATDIFDFDLKPGVDGPQHSVAGSTDVPLAKDK